MSAAIDKIYAEAASLPEPERAALAGLLVDTLEGSLEPAIEAAWRKEVAQRIADLESGQVTTVSWSQVRSKLRSIVGL